MARETAQSSGTDESSVPASAVSRVQDIPRRRQLLSRLTGSSRTSIPELEPLLRTLRQFHPKANRQVVERAYVMAAHLHSGQMRRSGEPYITHPLAVATILAELGMTPTTLAAALLHDTVEDTAYPLARLREDFGDEVARRRWGVTKLDKVQYGDASAAETVRKMVVAMARDIRVLVIKLADRLHNMRTIGWMPEDKQQKKSRETLEIYAPLAHRLGMNTIKWELEDLAFATLFPRCTTRSSVWSDSGRRRATSTWAGSGPDRRRVEVQPDQGEGQRPTEALLQRVPEDDREGRDFADIYDLLGVRILVDSIPGLLRRSGPAAREVEPGAGSFQGLHRQSAVRRVPLAAHDGDRTGGQTRRGADPHPGDAPAGRVRCCGALALQATDAADSTMDPTSSPGFANCWSGSGKPRIPTNSLTACATSSARGVVRFTPRAMSSRCRPAQRRWTSPTRCTPRSVTGRSAPG